MELNLEIEQELWETIAKNYENESYSSAILDAMHLLTETIRNKTGLEGDGTNLVGQAFGSENPMIKLNKLQTDSEKNIQKGIQDILRGFYIAIRNPRSHDKLTDTKQEADAIILFIDYLLKLIDKSKLRFEEETFLKRVFDKYYVRTEEYSDLLVAEIPKRQRANIAITIILRRMEGNIYNLRYVLSSLFKKLEDTEITRVYKVISEELKYTDSDKDIRTILHICPAEYWNRIDKAVKIRIENILKEDVKLGTYYAESESCGKYGALGTWITKEHLFNFESKKDWTFLIVKKLRSQKDDQIEYVYRYFGDNICALNYNNIDDSLKYFIIDGLKSKNKEIVDKLEKEIVFDKNHPWWKVFENELKEYPEIEYVEFPF